MDLETIKMLSINYFLELQNYNLVFQLLAKDMDMNIIIILLKDIMKILMTE